MRRNARTFGWPPWLCTSPVLTSAECKVLAGVEKPSFGAMVPHDDVSDAVLAIRRRLWNEHAQYSGKTGPNKEWENRHGPG